VFASLDAALARAEAWAQAEDADELMLIGGAQLYAEALPRAARLYLTRVGLAPEGDAFFPEIDGAAWRLASSIEHAAADDAPAYAFEVWERR
ncbi:TPA: dihydrofolate reductase, partial [Pseudomonas aeruginosa]|nr:dihydrofolate reductase [Pseudomonas aeruginosa]